ncbi:uncharacterized protein F4807DRAFT_283382 [Annulohypoxylon truncatum]|uniref:uncharacterized protein n=1 Tax=Annulohypoxylon truncatum TaxID=327061 RepID=UPI002008A390|nr:uncharacterized protein F4807DRAFT_283382 [Annulohypoxylon truncatum]KAI1205381.1 hypothetical protein F4807DRAFT_283382 [Annulohypoxylon truncatum]
MENSASHRNHTGPKDIARWCPESVDGHGRCRAELFLLLFLAYVVDITLCFSVKHRSEPIQCHPTSILARYFSREKQKLRVRGSEADARVIKVTWHIYTISFIYVMVLGPRASATGNPLTVQLQPRWIYSKAKCPFKSIVGSSYFAENCQSITSDYSEHPITMHRTGIGSGNIGILTAILC